jgi:hypothetical protein
MVLYSAGAGTQWKQRTHGQVGLVAKPAALYHLQLERQCSLIKLLHAEANLAIGQTIATVKLQQHVQKSFRLQLVKGGRKQVIRKHRQSPNLGHVCEVLEILMRHLRATCT